MSRTRIGIVGCGTISGAYMTIAPTFDNLEIVACADLIEERARIQAEEFGIDRRQLDFPSGDNYFSRSGLG